MRLLNTKSLVLTEFMDGAERPPYAVLSHTWGEEEVSFQEMQDPARLNVEKQGYKKIKAACNKAWSDGFSWIWIDTCSIDKSSSAELSEAINSMFTWYQSAQICYAYLADVPALQTSDLDVLKTYLAGSVWFTRGWTLQELVAPARVEFLCVNWTNCLSKSIAMKSDLDRDIRFCDLLCKITGVDVNVLRGTKSLAALNIATKMSWASKRKTTRPEDIAYCLLGLFDVNIPLLYGEGAKKAFTRLQEELMKNSDDQSLFCWTQTAGNSEIARGPLAESPAEFMYSQDVSSFSDWTCSYPYSMTNLGLQISLPILNLPVIPHSGRDLPQYFRTHIGVLNCTWHQQPRIRPAIELYRITPDGDQYARVNPGKLAKYPHSVRPDEIKTIYIRKQIKGANFDLENAYVINIPSLPHGFKFKSVWPTENWDPLERVIRVPKQNQLGVAGGLLFEGKKCSFVVLLGPCDKTGPYREYAAIQTPHFPAQPEFVSYCEAWQKQLETGVSLYEFSTNPEKNIMENLRVEVSIAAYNHKGTTRYRVLVTVVHK